MSQKLTKKLLGDKAKELGVKNAAKLAKADLIHAIQLAEGNSDCFGRIPDCQIRPCLYRSECMGD